MRISVTKTHTFNASDVRFDWTDDRMDYMSKYDEIVAGRLPCDKGRMDTFRVWLPDAMESLAWIDVSSVEPYYKIQFEFGGLDELIPIIQKHEYTQRTVEIAGKLKPFFDLFERPKFRCEKCGRQFLEEGKHRHRMHVGKIYLWHASESYWSPTKDPID